MFRCCKMVGKRSVKDLITPAPYRRNEALKRPMQGAKEIGFGVVELTGFEARKPAQKRFTIWDISKTGRAMIQRMKPYRRYTATGLAKMVKCKNSTAKNRLVEMFRQNLVFREVHERRGCFYYYLTPKGVELPRFQAVQLAVVECIDVGKNYTKEQIVHNIPQHSKYVVAMAIRNLVDRDVLKKTAATNNTDDGKPRYLYAAKI